MRGTNRSMKRNVQNIIVQPRDRRLMEVIGQLRIVSGEQAKRIAAFGSTTRVNTRLLQLVRAGLLRRFFLGSGGGRKAIYSLSTKGAQLLGVPVRGLRRHKDAVLVADFFVQHQLTVNDVYCALTSRSIADITSVRWMSFFEPIAPGLKLIPDGYAQLQTPVGKLNAFLEVDLGHEGLAVWREKARQYRELAVPGLYQMQFHEERFRVLVLVHSERRLHTIRKAMGNVTEKIFWFATLEAVGKNFIGAVWLRPTEDQPQPLI